MHVLFKSRGRTVAQVLCVGILFASALGACDPGGGPDNSNPACNPTDTGQSDAARGGSNTTLVGARDPQAPQGGQSSADERPDTESGTGSADGSGTGQGAPTGRGDSDSGGVGQSPGGGDGGEGATTGNGDTGSGGSSRTC